MKRSFSSLALVSLFALLPGVAPASLAAAPSAAAVQAAADATTDAALTSKVKARLDADAEIKAANIDVTTANGVVTLKGSVASPVLRVKIFDLAKGTEGVTKIVNKLTLAKK